MTDTVTIALPEDVRREIEAAALRKGVSPEDFIAAAAAEKAGAVRSAAAYFSERAARAKPGAFERVFGDAREGGDEPPQKGDER
ncbi:MAG: hypothetical protein ABUL73_06115 [Alphaproteobacteria bacterium]